MKVYCIPGLGFDHRIFGKLLLAPHDLAFIDWLEPEPGEPLAHYVERMAEPIDEASGPVALIGHSFGGVVAQEIARLRKVDCVVLLASIRSRRENPIPFRLLKPLGLHALFRKGPILAGLGPLGSTFDYDRGEEQALVRDMVSKQSNRYLRWALGRLSEWHEQELPASTRVVQIHGDHDLTFPLRRIQQPDHVLERAGHFFLYKRAEDVTPLILAALEARDPSRP